MAAEQAIVTAAFGLVLGAFVGYVGLLLLRLRPPYWPRILLAVGFLLAALTSLIHLRQLMPGPLDTLLGYCFLVGAGAAWPLSVLFLALYPTPVRWRTSGGVLVAGLLAYGVICVLLDFANTATQFNVGYLDAWIGFGAYSWQKGALLSGVIFAAVLRARTLPPDERRIAIRVLAATTAGALLFAGYGLIQHANQLLHGPLNDALARYPLLWTRRLSPSTQDLFIAIVQLTGAMGMLVMFAVWNRDRLAWALAGVGALAYVLDQFTRSDIIDLGIASLVTPPSSCARRPNTTRWASARFPRASGYPSPPPGASRSSSPSSP